MKKKITKCSLDLPHTCLDILPQVPPNIYLVHFQKKYFQNRSPPPFSSHSFSKIFSNQVEPPPARGERGTRRQHCKQHLESRCKTLVQRRSPRSLMSPRQLLTGEGSESESVKSESESSLMSPRQLLTGKENKTISDGGITVDFWIIKVHTSN